MRKGNGWAFVRPDIDDAIADSGVTAQISRDPDGLDNPVIARVDGRGAGQRVEIARSRIRQQGIGGENIARTALRGRRQVGAIHVHQVVGEKDRIPAYAKGQGEVA